MLEQVLSDYAGDLERAFERETDRLNALEQQDKLMSIDALIVLARREAIVELTRALRIRVQEAKGD